MLGQAISGGISLSGEQQGADIGGGGRFTLDFGEVPLFTPDAIQLWGEFTAGIDGIATPILVPTADRLRQPVVPRYTGMDTFGRLTWVDDPTAWTAEEVTATVSSDAAMGATTLSFALTAARKLSARALFAILHPTFSWRLYEVSRVNSGGTVGSAVATTVTFRPPLREAVSSGDAINLESPRGVMQAQGDLSATVESFRFGKAPASTFVEWPGPPPA